MVSALLHRDKAAATEIAAIYARYSTDRQRDASIDDQIRVCKDLIARHGWKVGPIYTDRQISGSNSAREGFQALRRDVRQGTFQVVVAESLDRLMRDTELSANFGKQCRFARVKIFTGAEGDATKLVMGIKSVVNDVFLDELADKTRRGLIGRVEAGASAGGLSYGYDVVAVPEGEDRGARTIDQAKAAVVVRIFRDYAAGLSPKAIAAALNHEGVPGPRTEGWSQSTINGNRKRGTGIINNELYVGVLVWNRLSYMKDPNTNKRCSRLNPESECMKRAVPDLRIIDQTLWDRVKARQAALDAAAPPIADGSAFQLHRRPTYLLSGLLRCGACGGGMSVISATHVGCSNARNKGEAICSNRRTVKREFVEATVLDGLRTRLMAPEVYAAFVRSFTTEWNAAQKGRAVELDGKRDELKRTERKIGNLVEAIGGSGGSPAVFLALKEAEARQAALQAELATAEAPAPRLMPNLAELYREKVAALQEALAGEDAAAAREQVRALIDEVRIIPSPADAKTVPTIEVRGQLAAMLALGSGKDASAAEQLEKQIKLVAGAGFEPAAFRL